VEFRVLGSLEVRHRARPLPLASLRQRTLLVRLLVDAGSVVSIDALAAALWGDDPPAAPRNAIQTYVARLRDALGDDLPLITRPPGYVLDVGAEQVDALRFEQLLAEARQRHGRPAEVLGSLDEAVGLWRGPAYAGFEDGIARSASLRLRELRATAIEDRAAARLALGESGGLVGELEAEIAEQPLRERLVALLMEALAVSDRQAEALAAYRAYRQRLADGTGLEPSPAIRQLEGRVLRGELAGRDPEPAVGSSSSAPQAAPRTTGGGPPVPVTSLIGRQGELAELRTALGRQRVVTLTGTGGVGKTRLAAEVAAEVAAGHGHDRREVAWIELGAVADPASIVHVVATAVGIDLDGGSGTADLVGALAGRQLLLVLDNAEHLLGAVAPLVDAIHRACPRVQVLTTSRERLAVEGERVLQVGPLASEHTAGGHHAADGQHAAAIELFLDRATDAGGDHDPADLETVAAICSQVDGLPLAIELAAARTSVLAPSDLLAALREDLPGSAGHRRSLPARHRDLWAVVDWSYRLLSDDEQRLFERLSVFAGAFGVDEVQAVCALGSWDRASTLDRLTALAEQSLLVRQAGWGEGPGRYRLLRPVRAFARQRLADRGELASLADRHAAVLTARAEEAAGPPLTEEGRRWLEGALDDLRVAQGHAKLTGDGGLLGRLVAALYRFGYWRPGIEVLAWAQDALELDGAEDGPTAPQVHAAAAAAAWRGGDLERARRLARRGTQLGQGADDPARTLAYEALGDVANFEGRLEEAEAAFREEVRLSRLLGDPDSASMGHSGAALVLAYAGRVDEAVREADAAARAAVQGGPATQAFARYAQGECLAETDPDRASSYVEEALELARSSGAWFVEGVALLTAASLRARHGHAAAALPTFAELVHHWRRSGSWTQQWTTLRNLAELLVRLGIDEDAVVIAAAASAAAVERSAARSFGPGSDRLSDALATARARLGDDAYEAAWARGAGLAASAVVDLALASIGAHTAGGRS
jgi:predicted ATPase/DNA-binding SARP family transcriptional activator